jgi:hypothetical protein
MKLPITLFSKPGGAPDRIGVSLCPQLVDALGLPFNAPLCAVAERRRIIVCRPEEAELWEKVLEDFPRLFIAGDVTLSSPAPRL